MQFMQHCTVHTRHMIIFRFCEQDNIKTEDTQRLTDTAAKTKLYILLFAVRVEGVPLYDHNRAGKEAEAEE